MEFMIKIESEDIYHNKILNNNYLKYSFQELDNC